MEPTYDPAQLRSFVALQTLGLCTALEAGAMSAGDAQRWLFRNEMVKRLSDVGACVGCTHLVELGSSLTALLEHGKATPERIGSLKELALGMLAAEAA